MSSQSIDARAELDQSSVDTSSAHQRAQVLYVSFYALIAERDKWKGIEKTIWSLNDGNPPPPPISTNLSAKIASLQKAVSDVANEYESNFGREYGHLRI